MIITTWLVIAFAISLTWLIAKYFNNPSLIDVFWPIGLFMAGMLYAYPGLGNSVPLIFLGLLLVWALRLGGYLLITRILRGIVDKRYLVLHQESKNVWLSYYLNFLLQGVFIALIALPFIWIAHIVKLSLLHYAAMMLIITGIIGESTADYQLTIFKKTHPGKLCDAGLWYYSRHPNYFFDWLTWVGFALAGCATNDGVIGFISPLVLLIIMLKITGPLTEKASIQSRGEIFLAYQRTTSMFFLWFKRA